MKKTAIALAILVSQCAHADLIRGKPSSSSGTPLPRFGTLINFDDGVADTVLAPDRYAGLGVASITNTLGPSLSFLPSPQSAPNYIGTGPLSQWDADVLVKFSSLQAAVGVGIAGPTTLKFELLDADMNLLEGYSLSTTPPNTYYYISRLTADTSYLRVAGDFVAIDDLQFSMTSVVPEPQTHLMMLAGLLLLAPMLPRDRVSRAKQP